MNPDPTPELRPIVGHAAIHFPASHLISPTTILALRRLAQHEKRRKRLRLTRKAKRE